MNLRHVAISLLTRGTKKLSVRAVRNVEYYFSQYGEDIIVSRYFPAAYRGFFVEVGALHPYRYSNSALFHIRGWRGITIDPNPEAVLEFERARPEEHHVCAAVAHETGVLRYQMFSEPAFNRLRSSNVTVADHAPGGGRPIREIDVPVEPLSKILEGRLPASRRIDFLSVDCEGTDFDVLRSHDWDRNPVNVVCVEDWDASSTSAISALMAARGFDWVGQTHQTRVFKNRKFDLK